MQPWIVSYRIQTETGPEIRDRIIIHAPDELEARRDGAMALKRQASEVTVERMPAEGGTYPSDAEVKELQKESQAAATYPDYLRNIHG